MHIILGNGVTIMLDHNNTNLRRIFIKDYENTKDEKVRDKIHLGHTLLSHPLSGSVKPNETPYKSVMVSVNKGQFDMNGLEIIELALQSCKKFQFRSDKYAPHVYEDFKIIDCTLIESGCESADLW